MSDVLPEIAQEKKEGEDREEAMKIREWPPGHRLFSEGGFCLSFDPPEDAGENPAIFCSINDKIVTVMAVAAFATDEAALAWFAEQRKRRGH